MNNDLRVAVVCSSNQNRSMEAHAFLSKKGFKVRSFGSGNQVKLPGPAPDKPNVYDFSISYEQMYQDLLAKDKALYTQNGLLHMLDRNRRIKSHPERFQSCYEIFDVIFTVEERVYDQVVEELASRSPRELSPVHIINIDVQDNHEEATIGAFLVCEMATMMAESEDLDNDIDELLQEFESKAQRPILHTVQFY
ncbi:RNA polymerase II subunit A C-terminal domain phosphatase SSU72-like [Argiope bruennichi]|uniref:RNA polymerase II subunit A C-terminal domain phosphatase SSU72-like n=1 Tax=Argiope bruennichi TaxID=94029 RepID=UPI002495260C|nr:RNA polymerase II subunit A C-terminal domain phosphatase SSU72-like [Argiope bruennichi]